jgi:hypothetical protein
VDVKVLPRENELYVFAQSQDRLNKERAMRRRQLKALWKRLGQLQQMKLNARELLLRLGEAKGRYRAAWRLIDFQLPEPTTEIASFSFALNRQKLRQIRRREGRYLLRTNLCGREPAQLWQFYIQLVEIEAAFKNLKDDLALRPIYHQLERRIEAHIFVAFMAYCLQVTLRARLRPLAPGLTPRAVLDKFAAIQMLDVHFPTTDGRTLILSRYTHLNRTPSRATLKEKWPFALMWSRADVIGLFSNNVVSFSRNVVLSDPLFSLNSVSKPRMLSVRTVYVLGSLQLGLQSTN